MSKEDNVFSIDQHAPSAIGDRDVEVYFDGECPLCVKEINMLRRLDKRQRIRFVDISDARFSPQSLGTTYEKLMSQIQARLPDGSFISGVEVFRRLYGAVGFRRLVRASRWPGVSHVLDFGYERFAKNRLRWTGRCDNGACPVAPTRA